MTVEEFLENSAYGWESAGKLPQLQEAYADAEKMDPKTWVNKWAPVIMDTPELTADFYDSKLLNTTKSLDERLAQTFGSSDKENPFRKSDKWLNQLYHSEFSDIPREQFDQAINARANYWDDFKKEREREAGKTRRKKEVEKDWPWYGQFLASDYEKQRYINEPETAIFGKEAPLFGDAPETRWGSFGDLAAGVAGAAGDVLPGAWGFAGPAIRFGRDVAHTALDSKYAKTWPEIMKDAGTDVGVTAATAFLPNFRRGRRMASNIGGTNLQNIVNIELDAEQVVKNVDELRGILGELQASGAPYREQVNAFRQYYRDMPDSELKTALTDFANKVNPQLGELDYTLGKFKMEYSKGLTPSSRNVVREAEQIMRGTPKTTYVDPKTGKVREIEGQENVLSYFPDIYGRIAQTTELSPTEMMLKPALKAANKFMTGEVGGAALKLQKHVTGFPGFTKPTTYDEDWYRENYARDFEAGFKPTAKAGDPKWEAYRQWHYNKYGEYPPEDTGKETWEFQFPEVNIRK